MAKEELKINKMTEKIFEAAIKEMNHYDYPHTHVVLAHNAADFSGSLGLAFEDVIGEQAQSMIERFTSDRVKRGELDEQACTGDYMHDLLINGASITNHYSFAGVMNATIGGAVVVPEREAMALLTSPEAYPHDKLYIVGVYWSDKPLEQYNVQVYQLSQVTKELLQGESLDIKMYWVG